MILHIPHSGTNTLGRDIELFDIAELTDWFTDELFKFDGMVDATLIQDVSRFVCDVERFYDEQEEMFKKGQGICYTKGTRNNDIEVIDKKWIIKNIYDEWHKNLNKTVAHLLCDVSPVVIVDCHSFSDKKGYPDFCIGTNNQTPKELIDLVLNELKDFNIQINYPYSGCMTPSHFIGNNDVMPIMIEVNKKLYIKNKNDFEKTKCVINKLLTTIDNFESHLRA